MNNVLAFQANQAEFEFESVTPEVYGLKAALITEEQIARIEYSLSITGMLDALEVLRSLTPQEPVGFKQQLSDGLSWHKSDLYPIPVYAAEKK